MPAPGYLIGCLRAAACSTCVAQPLRGSVFDQAQRMDEGRREAYTADREIIHRTLRLCPIECISRHLDLA